MVSCHLSLQRQERLAQAGRLMETVDALGVEHAVVAGDLNDVPSGRSFRRLAGRYQDCWEMKPQGGEYTFPAHDPRRRLDAVFATDGIEVLGCGVPDGLPEADLRAATDHLPVLAALRVPAT